MVAEGLGHPAQLEPVVERGPRRERRRVLADGDLHGEREVVAGVAADRVGDQLEDPRAVADPPAELVGPAVVERREELHRQV